MLPETQYSYVNQGPVYSGPASFAPVPSYQQNYGYTGGPYANAMTHYSPVGYESGPAIYSYRPRPAYRPWRPRPVYYGGYAPRPAYGYARPAPRYGYGYGRPSMHYGYAPRRAYAPRVMYGPGYSYTRQQRPLRRYY